MIWDLVGWIRDGIGTYLEDCGIDNFVEEEGLEEGVCELWMCY